MKRRGGNAVCSPVFVPLGEIHGDQHDQRLRHLDRRKTDAGRPRNWSRTLSSASLRTSGRDF